MSVYKIRIAASVLRFPTCLRGTADPIEYRYHTTTKKTIDLIIKLIDLSANEAYRKTHKKNTTATQNNKHVYHIFFLIYRLIAMPIPIGAKPDCLHSTLHDRQKLRLIRLISHATERYLPYIY